MQKTRLQQVIAQKRVRMAKIPRTENSADFYSKGCAKADQEVHVARLSLVVLDVQTPKGLRVEVDLRMVSVNMLRAIVQGYVLQKHDSVSGGASLVQNKQAHRYCKAWKTAT
eukprot:1664347-Amphidinium_carterae.1